MKRQLLSEILKRESILNQATTQNLALIQLEKQKTKLKILYPTLLLLSANSIGRIYFGKSVKGVTRRGLKKLHFPFSDITF